MKDLTNHELTVRLLSLEQAFNASAKRSIDNTYTAESANSKADALTPTTFTKTAYIGDTEVEFKDIPTGKISIYIENTEGDIMGWNQYRSSDIGSFFVKFEEPLNYVTTVTISII